MDCSQLAIHTSRQRPPPEFTPRKTFIRAVRARQLTVREASYRAEADPPLGLAEMMDISGTFERVVWSPGSKEVSATGSLEASSFQTGNLRMDQVVIPNVVARRSDLSIDNGTFVYGEGRGTLGGEVKHFHTGADSRFDVSIENARAEHIVQAATGRPSPLFATVSGTLTVHSGGDRPRGSAWMDARLRLMRGF